MLTWLKKRILSNIPFLFLDTSLATLANINELCICQKHLAWYLHTSNMCNTCT